MKTHLKLFAAGIFTCFISCKKYNSDQKNPEEKKWIVTTLAGNGQAFFADGPAIAAKFRAPQDVAVGSDGSVYVADALNHRIRKISGGQVSTVAGFNLQDTSSGTGTSAGFAHPVRLAIDKDNNIYTLDFHDFRVRKINQVAEVTVKAGSGIRGFQDGPPGIASFGEAFGIALDYQGNIYVSDQENKRIRKIEMTGDVSTVAGNGQTGFIDGDASSSEFFEPSGIVADNSGNLFVADFNRIRKITPSGIVSTFVGGKETGYRDGSSLVAAFSRIEDMVMDSKGNIFLSDDNRIRKVSADGEVSTIAGGKVGYLDGNGTSAEFNLPNGLGIDADDNLYIADSNNNRIRKISYQYQ